MDDRFISTITMKGSKEDIDRFINEFTASAIRVKGKEILCICQFVDPLPTFIYYSNGYFHKGLQRPLTDEEILIYEESMIHMQAMWGVNRGCSDGKLIRVNENEVMFKFWTPETMISPRILLLLHNKYLNINIIFNGEDEYGYDPRLNNRPIYYEIRAGNPPADIAELDNIQRNIYEREKQKLLNFICHGSRD